MKNNLTAHMLVKNEEQWIWYAINSVINRVDQIIIYDTGSCDNTIKIIESINNGKIKLTKAGEINSEKLIDLRNKQIEETNTDWFLILDGDEVWPEITIKELVNKLLQVNSIVNAIVVPAILPLGDLYHYQPENAGKYNILGRTGHYNIRCYRKTNKYRWKGIYPLEAYMDDKGNSVQQKPDELELLTNNYWHLTHLKRSRFSHNKFKLEIGDFRKIQIPETFYIKRPKIIPAPWVKYSIWEYLLASILTPVLKIKRKIICE
ncbi:MAG: Glycosyl transferase family 2 [Candidatus Gottesmanbacteria bacterium GW2011_GWA1_34_13]|uniref:Glycosyl transferase family 2 n=1 Tax=Candidatus Gottesmanbacteria bacterium GW2011_GWA1_34_13 TaxID=1618434 RepID=A0A0G0DXP9_9BACT|nr:MAG: Glycosyl transferase family 2 [Candidatus Gottesmanbacteria bacterium GW2011_GWA1_34_13]